MNGSIFQFVHSFSPHGFCGRTMVGDAEAISIPKTVLGFVVLITLTVGGCRQNVDLETAGLIDRAQETFDRAESEDDYLLAASQYQEILDRGIVSGAALFNQGNAFMRAGERGRAIASYRRAQRYRPRDPYLDANLRFALGEDSPAKKRRLMDFLVFWQDWISYSGKFYLLGVLGVVSLLLAIAALATRVSWFNRLALTTAVITLLVAGSAAYDWYRYESVVHGVVVEDEVVARMGNAGSYEPAFTEPLAEGTEFQLLERRGDWIFIRLASGPEGWIEETAAVMY